MFKNKNFSILLFGRLITNFGDSIYSIATLTLIYSLTKSTFYSGITLFLISFTAILQIFISPIISKFDVKKEDVKDFWDEVKKLEKKFSSKDNNGVSINIISTAH